MANKPADKLKELAYQMHHGILTYAEAHALAKPIVDEMNAHIKELSKENQVPFRKISFTHFTR